MFVKKTDTNFLLEFEKPIPLIFLKGKKCLNKCDILAWMFFSHRNNR